MKLSRGVHTEFCHQLLHKTVRDLLFLVKDFEVFPSSKVNNRGRDSASEFRFSGVPCVGDVHKVSIFGVKGMAKQVRPYILQKYIYSFLKNCMSSEIC